VTETTANNTRRPKVEAEHLLLAFLITTLFLCIGVTLIIAIHHFLKRRRFILSQDTVTWELPFHRLSLNDTAQTQHSTTDMDTSEMVVISQQPSTSTPSPINQPSTSTFINQSLSSIFASHLTIMDYSSTSSFTAWREGLEHEQISNEPTSPGSSNEEDIIFTRIELKKFN